MPRLSLTALTLIFFSSAVCRAGSAGPDKTIDRVTILYDVFTKQPALASDWGYAALVEFEGKRILFDTGNNAALFEANIKRLKVDLLTLDMVVISHRHGDHTAGLRYVLSVNPNVPVYAPADESFRDTTPPAFLKQSADPSLPPEMRYFAGQPPATPPGHGTAWPQTHIHTVDSTQDISAHIHLISTTSELPGFRDMPELSLVLDTPQGPIVVVGCSHPGIENILANLTKQTGIKSVYEIVGGLHLVVSTPAQIDHTASELLDKYQVKRMAVGHCTGERAFALFQKRLGTQYLYAGTGETVPLLD